MNRMYQDIPRLYVIAGLAGSGKTRLIKSLQKLGTQAIDLEGLAGHRGSVFGFNPTVQQPNQKFFHQRLKSIWQKLDTSQVVFIERERPFIGCLDIPEPIYAQMQQSPIILLKTNRYRRIEHILFDYSHLPTKEINEALDKLAPNLGREIWAQCKSLLEKHHLPQLVDCLLDYYDQSKNYQVSGGIYCTFSVEKQSFAIIAKDILNKV